jgi:hypothetical protein
MSDETDARIHDSAILENEVKNEPVTSIDPPAKKGAM